MESSGRDGSDLEGVLLCAWRDLGRSAASCDCSEGPVDDLEVRPNANFASEFTRRLTGTALPCGQEFDTVLAATGRAANVGGLGLEAIGLSLSDSGKVRLDMTATSGV